MSTYAVTPAAPPATGNELATAIAITVFWRLADCTDGQPGDAFFTAAALPQPTRGAVVTDGTHLIATVGPYACDAGELPAGVAAFTALCQRLAARSGDALPRAETTMQITLTRAGMPPADVGAVASLLAPSLLLLLGDGGTSPLRLAAIGGGVQVSARYFPDPQCTDQVVPLVASLAGRARKRPCERRDPAMHARFPTRKHARLYDRRQCGAVRRAADVCGRHHPRRAPLRDRAKRLYRRVSGGGTALARLGAGSTGDGDAGGGAWRPRAAD